MDRRAFLGLTWLTLVGLLSQSDRSRAQNWPQRRVKIIVPIGAGSTSDICARAFADKLSAIWQQPVVVENRPGGDAIVGFWRRSQQTIVTRYCLQQAVFLHRIPMFIKSFHTTQSATLCQ